MKGQGGVEVYLLLSTSGEVTLAKGSLQDSKGPLTLDSSPELLILKLYHTTAEPTCWDGQCAVLFDQDHSHCLSPG